ncbi:MULTISPECIES: DNA adenine methylase [Bacillus subtilis group]|uniref:DNA adenine methylase n=1 Tax=Bacillus paralicheniformis TaxID=1648923 RepID=A0AAW6KET7_9BACI|nr:MULTISPECIES: DNA adenine methylase [Bacillus subtilis group]MBC8621369.1 DNA adenine methylase [Robertmurraya crescens]MBL7478246.1 DNA adenine methylase [Bacillus paralicheniformis]MCM3424072.1 DNA adenine methylase [Bacillus paralicheniformis]MDE1385600.1 DNA adenine methylase [Bacillus paralicheniformis]MDE1453722.1 DNA adenine methylase [Bacillus paralicheniformis]
MPRSPLIWFGGKAKYAEHIINKMPAHKVYVEPFGGAAHVIANKPKISHEVYNDIDGNVVNFLMQVRKDPKKMQKACESIPYSRALYEKWKSENYPIDDFDRAVRWFYMNRSGISKGNADNVPQTGWRHSTKSGQNPAGGYISACTAFQSFANRMKGVMIECQDFRKIIEKYDSSETLFYVDPPYVGREKFYAGGFTEQDHRDLARLLIQAKGKVVLSYYDDPLILELYPNWEREIFSAYKQVVGGSGKGNWAEEMLLFNYKITQLSLFD